MATAYSGFASRKLEDLYNGLLQKTIQLLSLKVLVCQEMKDEPDEMMKEERSWTKKVLKVYRTMRKLESRKYHGAHFATEFRQLTSYFANKHEFYQPSG